MQPFNRAIMTDAGSSLFMRAQAGEIKIQFTKVAVGDGTYSEEERKIASQQIQTELKSQKNSYPLSKIEVVSDHSVKVTAIITNYDPLSEVPIVENGYYINEMGLFAKEHGSEDDETEILYSIAIVQSETGDFMPPYDGNNPAQIIQEYYATVSNSEDVTIETGKGAVALAEDVEKLKVLDFDDSGEVEGIESFTDFMSSFVKNTSIYQLFANLKAGLKYVLHAGQLVNNGLTETPGEFALDAAYGKILTDQITGLYSDMQKYLISNNSTFTTIEMLNPMPAGTHIFTVPEDGLYYFYLENIYSNNGSLSGSINERPIFIYNFIQSVLYAPLMFLPFKKQTEIQVTSSISLRIDLVRVKLI